MKKSKNKRTKWVHLRVSQEEHDLLQKWVGRTPCQKASQLTRNILFHQPIQVFYFNKSALDFLTVAIGIKNELNSIGNNINQAVIRLHTFPYNDDLGACLFGLETDQKILKFRTDQLTKKMQEIYVLLRDQYQGSKPDLIDPLIPGDTQTAAADRQRNKPGQ